MFLWTLVTCCFLAEKLSTWWSNDTENSTLLHYCLGPRQLLISCECRCGEVCAVGYFSQLCLKFATLFSCFHTFHLRKGFRIAKVFLYSGLVYDYQNCLTCHVLDFTYSQLFNIICTCMICVCLHLTQKKADLSKYIVSRKTIVFSVTSHFPRGDMNTVITRLLASGHGQLHAKRKRSTHTGRQQMKWFAFWSHIDQCLSKMKGWSVVTTGAKPQACRQTHRRIEFVIKEMARARTVIFYLY